MQEPILYRNENYGGEHKYSPSKVLYHEIFELGNDDIVNTIINHYASKEQADELRNELKHLRDLSDNGKEPENCGGIEFVNRLLEIVESKTGKHITAVLWLASEESVRKNYEADEPDAEVKAYYTSNIILSNIGEDGCLFGYEQTPQPLYRMSYPILVIRAESIAKWDCSAEHTANLLADRPNDEYSISYHDFNTGMERKAYCLALEEETNQEDLVAYTSHKEIDFLNEKLKLRIHPIPYITHPNSH